MGNEIQLTQQRDNYADFLKYFLIWMVVLGHFINFYQYRQGIGGLFNCIYSFHMPLFVFISGYFSKYLNSYKRKSIDTLLYPFILFQLLNIVYTIIIPCEPLSGNVFYPYHQNWYLIALFWWRTFSPYKQFFKDKVVIITTVIISLGIGFFPEWSGFLGLYKTAYFLPFFILGSYCEDLSTFINRLMQHKTVWVIVLFAIMSFMLVSSFNVEALNAINYGFCAREGYNGNLQNLIIRTVALVVSFITCCSVLVVTKVLYEKHNSLINRWMIMGGGTMLAYLGHEFIMIPVIRLYYYIGGGIGISLCIITSLLVTILLSEKRIVKFFSPLLDFSVLCEKLKINIYK